MENIFKFKIDEKSLFYGIENDYERGQTATVSTPINQSSDPNKWHKDIMKLFTSGLSVAISPQLAEKCMRKTTSQAKSKIDYFFPFSKILLDGIPLNTKHSFAIYVKEEMDTMIKNKSGQIVPNTHLGRLKLHYPITLKYRGEGLDIDNGSIMNAILIANGGFAFIVRGFEVNIEQRSLNFITSIIGLKGILLSSVFLKKKGTGKKLLLKTINLEAQDLSYDSSSLISNDYEPSGLPIDCEKIDKARAENGALGEKYVFEHLKEIVDEYVEEPFHTSSEYPTSPYDIEYYEHGVKKFLEVKSTSGSREVFNMSSGEIHFMKRYRDDYTLVLVTNVKDKFPKIKKLDCATILSLRKEYPKVRFYLN